MSIDKLLQWAANYHYPQLVLSPDLIIRAGRSHWNRFTRLASPEEMGIASARIERWERIAAGQAEVKR